MSELIFVTTDNCELCKKAENKIKFLKPFYQIRKVDVQEDHEEFLLRVPVLLKNNKVILSPHSATFTDECTSRMGIETTKNIIDFFENKLDKSMFVKL